MGKWQHRLSNINEISKTAICAVCGEVQLKKKYDKKAKAETNWRCLNQYWKQRFGADRIEIFPKPINCEICHKQATLAYDHDHKSGKHRGWLCRNCNVALGLINDNIEILEKAIIYLKRKGPDI